MKLKKIKSGNISFLIMITISLLIMNLSIQSKVKLRELKEEELQYEMQLENIQKESLRLKNEVVLLKTDEYIAQLARKDFYLSKEDEMIFVLPN